MLAPLAFAAACFFGFEADEWRAALVAAAAFADEERWALLAAAAAFATISRSRSTPPDVKEITRRGRPPSTAVCSGAIAAGMAGLEVVRRGAAAITADELLVIA